MTFMKMGYACMHMPTELQSEFLSACNLSLLRWRDKQGDRICSSICTWVQTSSGKSDLSTLRNVLSACWKHSLWKVEQKQGSSSLICMKNCLWCKWSKDPWVFCFVCQLNFWVHLSFWPSWRSSTIVSTDLVCYWCFVSPGHQAKFPYSGNLEPDK